MFLSPRVSRAGQHSADRVGHGFLLSAWSSRARKVYRLMEALPYLCWQPQASPLSASAGPSGGSPASQWLTLCLPAGVICTLRALQLGTSG